MSAPSRFYQDWAVFWTLFCIFFFVIFWGTASLTWLWGEGSSWGNKEAHFNAFLSLLKMWLIGKSSYTWERYWGVIVDNGWVLKLAIHILLPVLFSLLIASFLAIKIVLKKGGIERVQHLNGPKLYRFKDVFKHSKKMYKKERKSNKYFKKGIYLHPKIPISTIREQNNLLVVGTTGSGKSTFIKYILNQVIKRGDHVLIYDEKKEYTSFFYNEKSLLIALWDSRGVYWSIGKDLVSDEDAVLVANNLIAKSKSNDPMWDNGARLIFAGMLIYLMRTKENWSWTDLANMLKTSQAEMLAILEKYYPIAQSFVVENSKTTQGFYVNLISNLSWLNTLAKAWDKQGATPFSIKEWVETSQNSKAIKPVLIIQSDPRFEAIGAPLCNAIISLMTQFYLSNSNQANRKTWLFIDEMANLPPNPSIQKWLELARSRGARSCIGTQSNSQLYENYGKNNADTILNLLSTVISMRVGSAGEEAKNTSRMFGEREVQRPVSLDKSVPWASSKEPLVSEEDLIHLEQANNKGVHGYLTVPSWNSVYKVCWPHFTQKAKAAEHMPAKWLSEKAVIEEAPQSKNRLLRKG